MLTKKNITYTMHASKEDVIEAIKLLARTNYGSILEGEINVEPIYKTEQIPLGVYDCDYINVFDGLKITVES